MPRKEYKKEFNVPISPDSSIRFRFDTDQGQVTDFVIQYEV